MLFRSSHCQSEQNLVVCKYVLSYLQNLNKVGDVTIGSKLLRYD